MIPLFFFLGAIAYRVRGTDWGKWYGRVACALLVSLPVAFLWPWGTAAFLPLAGLSLVMLCLPHDPSGRDWLKQLWTGYLFTLPAAAALYYGFDERLPSLFLSAAGAIKGACYLLPESNPEARWIPAPFRGRFLWRELAFGACWGAAAGAAI